MPEAKVQTLLAALLVEPGRPVPVDRLIDALWGDRPPRNPVGTLQARISQLRRVLEDAEPGGRALVVARPPGYALDVPPDAVDASEFAALLVRAGQAADPVAKAHLLGTALALWRGPAFAGFTEASFAEAVAAGLEERRLAALEEHAEARLELGEHAAVAAELAAAVAEHPLRERLRAAHLRALYRAGRQGEALAGYHDLRERLADDLGVEPGPELTGLYQSMLEQDPAETGRPRTAPRLPAVLGELIGRERETGQARALLAAHRLVTLTGTGGVGKTRLALETAARAAAVHPGGVWFVELAAGRPATSAEVARRIGHVLGLRDEAAPDGSGPSGAVERVGEALRGRRALLVLDNCEHVIEPVAELAGRLLSAAPGLRVLATSREPLGLPGERLLIVPPLDLPGRESTPDALLESGAARLFAARASAADPDFALDAASAPWVASVCRRLDGVPLALELAATRVRAFGVRELAARLDDRFRVLAGGRRGGPERQRTLRAVIDWSWGLLGEDERAVLRRLAVHAGGCTLAAAEEVCGADAEVLARLVDRSLVVRARDGRYRLLESVAAYGLERLREADEEAALRRNHVRYYTGLAQQAAEALRGPEQCAWLERLDQEGANLRTALDHGAGLPLVNALGWYWYLRGRFGEAQCAFKEVLEASTTAEPGRIEAETWLAGFTMLAGETTDSERLRVTALERYKDTDSFAYARAEWFLSHAHWAYGDMSANQSRVEHALTVFRARADPWYTAAALATRAKFALVHGGLAAMERDGGESMDLFTSLGDAWGRLEATDALSRRAEITGDYAAAAAHHREGLRLAEDLGMWPEVSFRTSGLGRLALLTAALDEARDLHERALEIATRQAARSAEEFAQAGLGLVARARGDLDAAERHLRAPLGWLRGIGGTAGIAFLHAQLGYVAELRGDPATALALQLEGLAGARATGDPRAVALALEGVAGARSLAGEHAEHAEYAEYAEYAEAARLLGEAAALRASAGAPLPEAEMGDINRAAGRITAALGVALFRSEFEHGRARVPTEGAP
ncbi:BTAD domain-containing putative transcriptional regulator [Actinomadura verrucosospora]|uniref:AfsR-like transcriptional regulator n=1 Tax=Actinomadura verrucosospora TaxID=46165 RepID=A0A7D3W079_ACTVE|nr:BTAD domain-containing putative transcriptional regulator [Actinomadura verrucosospora]QKG23091.1 AfsR-like transcriptional regulator [Actinomadura verrucosospora]